MRVLIQVASTQREGETLKIAFSSASRPKKIIWPRGKEQGRTQEFSKGGAESFSLNLQPKLMCMVSNEEESVEVFKQLRIA